MRRYLHWFKKHKIISGLIILVLLGIGYTSFAKYRAGNVPTQYVLAAVEKGSLITSVSGTGQVAVSSQVEVKAKASGDLLRLMIKDGQAVKSGQVLAYLNATEAQKAVRDAEVNLQSAKLSLDKLKKPSDALTVVQAQNALAQAQESKQKSQDAIIKGYEDALNAMSSAFLDLPNTMSGLDEILYGDQISVSEPTISRGQQNYAALMSTVDYSDRTALQVLQDSAIADYKVARAKYTTTFSTYKTVTRYSSQGEMEVLLGLMVDTVKAIAQSEKSQVNYIDAWIDARTRRNWVIFTQVKTYKTNLATFVGQTNGHMSSLLTIERSLKDNRDTVVNADRTIAEKKGTLDKIQAGTDPIDLRSQELAVVQRQNALTDARAKLADYAVRAPFDGIVAKVNVKLGDSIGSGASIATLVTPSQTATISLNEIDVAKIKVKQKVTMTFDAVESLTVTGHVSQIDTLGTVSQGVVTYNILILLDTQDGRIKPGMSVSAVIVTDIHQDVLVVPNAAIKTRGTLSYVETLDPVIAAADGAQGVTSPNDPIQKNITVGLSNDSFTEVVSGLHAGDEIITRTILPSAAAATTQAPSLFGSGTGNRGGATGAVRVQGR